MDIILSTLNTLLSKAFALTGDWGITIIVITLLVRIILLPISIKQRSSLEKQQLFSKKMEELKEKFKNDKEKLDSEIAKISQEGAKNLLGCSVTLLQFPIMYSLYRVFINMPANVGSIIIPWVASLKLPDTYFILPVLSVLLQLLPNILVSLNMLKGTTIQKLTWSQFILTGITSILFLSKAPVSLGIYWLTSNAFTFFEQTVYSLYKRNKYSTVQ